MSSWFSMDALTELKESATTAASAATTAAQAVLTDEAAREGLIKKLTLNTDELKSEREQMEVEETRKAEVKDKLSRLLPWETLDEEREILCEECRENILKLSTDKSTFTGPFALPGQSNIELAAKDRDEEDEGEAEEGQDGEKVSAADGGEEKGGDNDTSTDDHGKTSGEGGDGDQEATAATEGETSTKPDLSDEAVEAAKLEAKRAKLDPLPPLLQNFDLDAHVGLIQRLFDVDPNLVETHADLGGAGAREMAFWRNYFFHCALARYEAGLSVDEIWGEKPVGGLMRAAAAAASVGGAAAAAEETTVTFEPASQTGQMNDSLDDTSTSASLSAPSTGGAPTTTPTLAGPQSSRVSSASDYEMIAAGVGGVGSGDGGDGDGGGADEAEDMDDLEAEIARELEGLDSDDDE
mmetsp:Transcript_9876/g.22094  ORF Transcript_9876/g.22094 Transcript_9876/m.22094 type:complete len:410 (+) Transcript_9876:149-1378(+)